MFGNKYLFINIVQKKKTTQHKRVTEVNSKQRHSHKDIALQKNKKTKTEQFGFDRTRHEHQPVNPAVGHTTRQSRVTSQHSYPLAPSFHHVHYNHALGQKMVRLGLKRQTFTRGHGYETPNGGNM